MNTTSESTSLSKALLIATKTVLAFIDKYLTMSNIDHLQRRCDAINMQLDLFQVHIDQAIAEGRFEDAHTMYMSILSIDDGSEPIIFSNNRFIKRDQYTPDLLNSCLLFCYYDGPKQDQVFYIQPISIIGKQNDSSRFINNYLEFVEEGIHLNKLFNRTVGDFYVLQGPELPIDQDYKPILNRYYSIWPEAKCKVRLPKKVKSK